ncbi:FAD-dependent monooxygenase OpS4 [Apiospora saccharicola]|uniref:FAD-dependent monooxygenase OpS4 n=1 Tax=Apiospora saccharicola TaxID=335842 RepID=A0ABR1U4A1_9PEZI
MDPEGQDDATAWGPPVEIRVGCGVRGVREDGMGVVLESGKEVCGGLVIGADGIHSVVKSHVVGPEEGGKASFSGMAAFRFLLETDQLRADEDLADLGDNDTELDSLLSSFEETRKNRAARVQILSSVRAGLEGRVADRMEPYLDETVPKAPASHGERML